MFTELLKVLLFLIDLLGSVTGINQWHKIMHRVTIQKSNRLFIVLCLFLKLISTDFSYDLFLKQSKDLLD